MISLSDLRAFGARLAVFPWRSTAITLRERFREDRLGLTASSLTFTTTIALVPLVAVALSLFAAFPVFAQFQVGLQRWLVESLVPETIARQVLGYITQFARQSRGLGLAGLLVLGVTVFALVQTIDRTLNRIWRVTGKRPMARRMVVYWSAITLGPLLLGMSLALTSYAVTASRGLVGDLPQWLSTVIDLLQFLLAAGAMAALFHYVPQTHVKWSHAWTGGLFVSAALELAKKLLVLYLAKVPTYSVVYGTFATVPILLVWIYLSWVIVLLGAVIVAYLPSLLVGVVRRDLGAGWRFTLALEILQHLHAVRDTPRKGLRVEELAKLLRTSDLGVEAGLESLMALDWVGRLEDPVEPDAPRHVLLAHPDTTVMAPLVHDLLLRRHDSTEPVWRQAGWESLRLRDVL